MNDDYLTPKQAASYLHRSVGNLYNLVWEGKLRAYKPGGRCLLFKRSELQEWIEQAAVPSNAEIEAQAAARR